jgi:hypothetical protein
MAEDGLLSHTLTGGGRGVGKTELMSFSISPLEGKLAGLADMVRLLATPSLDDADGVNLECLRLTTGLVKDNPSLPVEKDLLLVRTREVRDPDSLNTERPLAGLLISLL